MSTPVPLRTRALAPLSLLALAACGGGDGPPVAATPRIEAFTAEPTSVAPGQTTTLRYQVVGAQRLRITTSAGDSVLPQTQNPEGMGSVVSNALNETTTFVLTAENAGGPATAEVTVQVVDPNAPRIDSFTASPATVTEGSATTLAWQTANGVGARIEVGGNQVYAVPAEQVGAGQWSVTPSQTETYTFVLVTGDGSTLEQSATVTVEPAGNQPVVRAFTASPTQIEPGGASTLSWQVEAATGVRITDASGGVVYEGAELASSQSVSPAQTTTYTLEARDDAGQTASQSVTVTVGAANGAQVASFTATPATVDAGDPSTLAWSVTNAPGGVRIEAGGQTVHTDTNETGSFSVTPSQTTTYLLTAINPNGDDTAMATVTVNPVVPMDPQITSFTSSQNPAVLGGTVDLSWATQDADTVRVLAGATEVFAGTATTTSYTASLPVELNTFTLEALAAGRPTAQATVTVYAHAAPTIRSFTVTPPSIQGPTTVTVSWDVIDVDALSLTQDGNPAPGFTPVTSTTAAVDSQGSLQVMVSAATTFELTASSAAGSTSQQVSVAVVTTTAEVEPNDTLPQAQAIPGATVVTGALTPADDLDIYRVTVADGGNVFLETSDGMGGCATDTTLILADTAGNTITFDEDSGPAVGCSRIDPTVDPLAGDLPAGDYLIGVLHAQATGTGPYSLEVRVGTPACGNGIAETRANEQCDFGDTNNGDGCSATCQLEINPTVVSAPGATVQVNLPTPDAIAVVQVNVTAGQSITATAADVGGATCNSVDTALNLGDSNLALVGAKVDGGPTGTAGDCAAIRFPEDAFAADLPAGTYYLVVFNTGASGGGPVELRIGVNNPVCGNGVVETQAGEQCDNTGGPNAVPCNAMCQVQTASDVTLPAASPTLLSGAITSGFDMYGIDVTQDVYLRAETFAPTRAAGCNQNTVLELYTDTFTFLWGDDDGGTNTCSRLDEDFTYTRLTPGRYYLIVAELNGAALPAYQLEIDSLTVGGTSPVLDLEPNDTQADAQIVGLTGPGTRTFHGAIDPDGDDDVYRIDVPAGATWTLGARTFDTYGNPTSCAASNARYDTRLFVELAGVEVSAPMSGELAYSDDISATQWCSNIPSQVLAGGASGASYYVRVQGYDDTGVRQYFLQISVQ